MAFKRRTSFNPKRRRKNAERGIYHGYPMPEQDPLAAAVREEWRKRDA